MELIADRYHGLAIDYSGGFTDFEQELVAILGGLDTQKLLWITVPIEESELVPVLTRHGFVFYVVCRGEALSKEIDIRDSDEIAEAKWVAVEDYLGDHSNAIYNRMLVEAALKGGGLTLDGREMPERGNWSRELFFLNGR